MESVLGGGPDAIDRAGRLGFAGVEIELRRGDLRSRERLEKLVRATRLNSLEVPALVLGEHNHGGIADADPHVAEAAAEDVEAAIGWAVELGAEAILVPFFLHATLASEDDVVRCEDAFRALCPQAAERGVALCYEGTLPAGRVRLLAERVGSAGFGCYFDLANPVRAGLDSPTEIRLLGELVRRVHVKDIRVTPGDCRPGLGRVDFRECAVALAEIGYDGWVVLETAAGPPPLAARDLSFARSVFPSLEPAHWPRLGAFSGEFAAGEWDRAGATFRRLGLEAVQLSDELLAEALEDPDVTGRLREHGVAVAALAGYRNLVAPDPAARRQNIDVLRRCLELAPALGTFVVATETGTRHPSAAWADSPENRSEEAWNLLHDALELLLSVAESAGTILALEGFVGHVLRTQSQLLGLFDRFPSEHLQLVCDPYNYVSSAVVPAEERLTAELLDRFEHRFVVAHIKDVDARGAEAGTPEFGAGVFAQRPYLEFLRTRRPDLPLVLEHLPLERMPAAIARVRAESPPA
jgi:sugar phosphate isomerase/epimerase